MCTTIVCFQACDVINFENKVFFLIKLFFYTTQNSRQKVKHLVKKRNFLVEKNIFHHFKVISLKQVNHFFIRWESDVKLNLGFLIAGISTFPYQFDSRLSWQLKVITSRLSFTYHSKRFKIIKMPSVKYQNH